jgi:hypothetical protein
MNPTQDSSLRLLACACADLVLRIYEGSFPDDDRPRQAIWVARLFVAGKANEAQLEIAASNANDAADGVMIHRRYLKPNLPAWFAARAAAYCGNPSAGVAARLSFDAACSAIEMEAE